MLVVLSVAGDAHGMPQLLIFDSSSLDISHLRTSKMRTSRMRELYDLDMKEFRQDCAVCAQGYAIVEDSEVAGFSERGKFVSCSCCQSEVLCVCSHGALALSV